MKSVKLFLTTIIIIIFNFRTAWAQAASQSATYYLHDNMGYADKMRMINISEFMIADAQMRIRQIMDVRDYHSYMMSFDVGVIMGNIREKYRRMVEIYREYRDKHSGRSQFFPPGFGWTLKVGYYIVAMQLVHTQEVEIDKLINVLELIDDDYLNPDPRYETLKRTMMRSLREGDMEIIRRNAAEQELKSSYREQHLQRKLNLNPAQHTTAKRFQRQWPVEKNWDLGQYGDMGLYAGH